MIKSDRLQTGLDPGLMNLTKDPISFGPSILHSAVSTSFKADSHCGKKTVVYISSGYMLREREIQILTLKLFKTWDLLWLGWFGVHVHLLTSPGIVCIDYLSLSCTPSNISGDEFNVSGPQGSPKRNKRCWEGSNTEVHAGLLQTACPSWQTPLMLPVKIPGEGSTSFTRKTADVLVGLLTVLLVPQSFFSQCLQVKKKHWTGPFYSFY